MLHEQMILLIDQFYYHTRGTREKPKQTYSPRKRGPMQTAKVMVTYSWDSSDHQEQVISFTQFLRENGFDCDIDVKLVQSQTSIDLIKMMHWAIANYSKIIIVLSKGYKEKAENFLGGVGIEYRLILNDIEKNQNKYILVTLQPMNSGIIPIGFANRDIVDMMKPGSVDKLFRKLMNQSEYTFSEVGQKKPVILSKTVAAYRPVADGSPIEIVRICCGRNLSQTQNGRIKQLRAPCYVEIKNTGHYSLADIQLEVTMPKLILEDFDNHTLIDNEVLLSFEFKKAYPGQPLRSKEFVLVFADYNLHLINAHVTVKVYTDVGISEREFIVKDFVLVYNRDQNCPPVMLSEDLFG